MKASKLFVYFFFIIVLSNLIYANEITEFTNELSSENLTFTGNQNITRYLEIYRNSNVTYTEINITGKENNNSYSIISNYKTEYNCLFNTGCTQFYDTSTTTYGLFNPCVYSNKYSYENYTIPNGTIINNSINVYEIKGANGIKQDYIPIGCINETNKLEVRVYGWCNTFPLTRVECKLNTGTWTTFLNENEMGGYTDEYYYSIMRWKINYPTNIYLNIGNKYNKTGIFNSTVQVNFTSELNSLIPECNCSGCSINTDYCRVPFIFHSDTSGILEYSSLNISYLNLLRILVRDENTGNLVTSKNVSVELFNDDYNYNYTTQISNDTINLNLPLNNLNIRYSGAGYSERIITTDLTESYYEITLYLLNSTTTTECSAVVYNELGNIQEEVTIEVYKYGSYNGQYNYVGSYLTNFEGKTNIYLELNSEYYQFKLYYPSATIRETTTPTYIYTCPITFQINTQEEIGEDFFRRQEIQSNLTFNNITNSFIEIYNDPNSLASKYCLYIYINNTESSSLYNYTCLTTSSGTISKSITAINDTKFISKFYIYSNSYWYLIDALNYEYKVIENTLINSSIGLFFIIVLTFIIVLISSKYILSLILAPIPLIIGSAYKIVNIDIAYLIGIEILCIIIAIILSRDR